MNNSSPGFSNVAYYTSLKSLPSWEFINGFYIVLHPSQYDNFRKHQYELLTFKPYELFVTFPEVNNLSRHLSIVTYVVLF